MASAARQRTVIIVRHGASPITGDDFARPLSAVGREQAATIGKTLSAQAAPIEMIFSSPAARAWETAQGIATKLGIEEIQSVPSLYNAHDIDIVQEIVTTIPNSIHCAVIVGHNPTLSDWCAELSNGTFAELGNACAIACSFTGDDWAKISDAQVQFMQYRP